MSVYLDTILFIGLFCVPLPKRVYYNITYISHVVINNKYIYVVRERRVSNIPASTHVLSTHRDNEIDLKFAVKAGLGLKPWHLSS